MLLLPGSDESLKTVTPTNDGLRFGSLQRNLTDADRVLAEHGDLPGCATCAGGGRLFIGLADGLCLAVRQMARAPHLYRFVPGNRIVGLDGLGLVDLAFGGPA